MSLFLNLLFEPDSYFNKYLVLTIYFKLLATFGFDTAENEPCRFCPLSAYRFPRYLPNQFPIYSRMTTLTAVLCRMPIPHSQPDEVIPLTRTSWTSCTKYRPSLLAEQQKPAFRIPSKKEKYGRRARQMPKASPGRQSKRPSSRIFERTSSIV